MSKFSEYKRTEIPKIPVDSIKRIKTVFKNYSDSKLYLGEWKDQVVVINEIPKESSKSIKDSYDDAKMMHFLCQIPEITRFIIPLCGIIENDQIYAIVTPYIINRTLLEFTEFCEFREIPDWKFLRLASYRTPWEHLLQLSVVITDVLVILHSMDIVHLHLDYSNILINIVDESWNVKIIDWSHARFVEGVPGDPASLSVQSAAKCFDVRAFGLILQRLLISSSEAPLADIVTTLSEIHAKNSQGVIALIQDCINIDESKQHITIQEVQKRLTQLAEQKTFFEQYVNTEDLITKFQHLLDADEGVSLTDIEWQTFQTDKGNWTNMDPSPSKDNSFNYKAEFKGTRTNPIVDSAVSAKKQLINFHAPLSATSSIQYGHWGEKQVVIKDFCVDICKYHTPDPSELAEEAKMMTYLSQKDKNSQFVTKIYGVTLTAIIMEYMPLGSLKYVIEKYKKPFGLRQDLLLRLALDVANALQFMHDMNIVHGDLKSANVLVSLEGNHLSAKLADFQNSGFVSSDRVSTLAGLFGWSDPYAYCVRKHSRSHDIYSFGTLLWEIATGKTKVILPDQARRRPPNENYTKKCFPVPESCPPALATLIEKCHLEPIRRIALPDIISTLNDIIKSFPITVESQQILRLIEIEINSVQVMNFELFDFTRDDKLVRLDYSAKTNCKKFDVQSSDLKKSAEKDLFTTDQTKQPEKSTAQASSQNPYAFTPGCGSSMSSHSSSSLLSSSTQSMGQR